MWLKRHWIIRIAVAPDRRDRKPKTHRVGSAHWWVEPGGGVVLRSFGGGSPRRLTISDLESLLAVFDGALEPRELDESLAHDCWFLQIRSQPCVRLKLPQAGRGNQDVDAHALLRRRQLELMLAEQG